MIPAASSRGLSDGGSGVGESVVCNDSRLLEDHLRKTGSKLAKQVRERGAEEILNDMQLLVGPPELRYIQNVAIMMFCEHPEKFFGYTYVQMTSFPKGSVENPSISEDFPNITGSVLQMIQATMERFRNLIIREKVIKVPNQMEALRIFNYPYQAIEEAVVNAFYHRDYMSFEPVTIEIEPDCINIMNFPGIDRSISEKTIAEGKRFVSRYYRNRRLGEFLKELDLSEGHSSGIPTIQEELEKNGSPSVLMMVIFPIVKLLNEKYYTRNDYEALFEINSSYAVKYLRKKERNKLLELLSAYRDVCKYSKENADTSCIMAYYNYKLKENGINPKKETFACNSDIQKIVDYYSEKPTDFEGLCSELFESLGYIAKLTPPTNDGGYDILLTRGGEKTIVECKCYSIGHKVGRPNIQKLVGANNVVLADKMIFITTSDFSGAAISYAEEVEVKLINGNKLMELLHKQGFIEKEKVKINVMECQLETADLYPYVPRDIYESFFE